MTAYYEYACEECHEVVAVTHFVYAHRIAQYVDKDGVKGKFVCDTCMAKTKRLRRNRANRARASNDNYVRDMAGVTVTVREQTSRKMWTLARAGHVAAALLSICESLDGAEGEWLIVSVSTPATILADIQGRDLRHGVDQDMRQSEVRLLGGVGRMDLLEPRVRTMAVSA